jgi:hypothetical protein
MNLLICEGIHKLIGNYLLLQCSMLQGAQNIYMISEPSKTTRYKWNVKDNAYLYQEDYKPTRELCLQHPLSNLLTL